jgi:hypothetical protein
LWSTVISNIKKTKDILDTSENKEDQALLKRHPNAVPKVIRLTPNGKIASTKL